MNMSLILNNQIEVLTPSSVSGHISTFLRNKSKRSGNTGNEYERDLRYFFFYKCKKPLESLNESDISIDLQIMLDYQTYLKDTTSHKNVTINRMISSVRSLYNYLKAVEFNVNISIFKQVKNLPDDADRIGILNKDEVFRLAELAETTEKNNAIKKKALILFASTTGIRKAAIKEIKYRHIRESGYDDDCYIVFAPEILDKGTQVRAEIHRKLFELIIACKENKTDDDIIFDIENMEISRMMKRLCKLAKIDDKRNISFHSLKKSGVAYTHELTGDLHAAQKQGRHKNPQTTERYLPDTPNLAGMAFFEGIDNTIYEKLDRLELIYLLQNLKGGVALQVQREAKKMINKRKI